MHDTQTYVQTWVAACVAVHLLAAVGKAIWKTPRQQAQIDTIESKVDALLAELRK